jgi:hypothetical protein
MVPVDVLSRVLAAQPVLDAIKRDQAGSRASYDHLLIGQSVTGLVKSQSRGITLVDIEGQTVAMRLPRPAVSGDTLKLSFAGHMPQPVFLLDTSDAAPADAPQLSQTARMLSDIMQRVPERTPPTLTPANPLLDQPAPHPAELALNLRAALVRSGLFYESHLANWALGLDNLDGLLQEPQNRLPAALSLPGATVENGPPAGNPLHALLTQQLQVLESPQFIWRGELWPGQPLEWQLKQEPDTPADAHARAGNESETRWESRLRLTLPQLGTLDVLIKLDARQAFSIQVVPQRGDVAPVLQDNQARLAERLAAAGCTLRHLQVETAARPPTAE